MPAFHAWRLRHCFAVALRERYRARAQDSRAEERAWKLFGLVPVMLLHRPRGTGSVGKDELVSRADDFVRGRWTDLLENIHDTSRQPRPAICETQEHKRRGHALGRVRQGQVLRARQELTGAALAPKTLETLAQLQERRPQERVWEIPQEVMEFVPDQPLELDFKCLQNAPSGCAPGPGGCTNEMSRTCLDDPEVFQLLFWAAEDCASASMPETIRRAFMSASMTPLRGITTGTLAHQFGKAVEATCAPLQFALSRRAGTDCVGHAIQAVTDANPCARCHTYDHVYRSAMLAKLHEVPSLQGLLPFVRAAHATSYVWEDEAGVQHRIIQAEGGEQSNPLMPLLRSMTHYNWLRGSTSILRPQFQTALTQRMTASERCSRKHPTSHRREDARVESGVRVPGGDGCRTRGLEPKHESLGHTCGLNVVRGGSGEQKVGGGNQTVGSNSFCS